MRYSEIKKLHKMGGNAAIRKIMLASAAAKPSNPTPDESERITETHQWRAVVAFTRSPAAWRRSSPPPHRLTISNLRSPFLDPSLSEP